MLDSDFHTVTEADYINMPDPTVELSSDQLALLRQKEKFHVGNLIAASGRMFRPSETPVILDWALIDCTNTTRENPLLQGKRYKIKPQ